MKLLPLTKLLEFACHEARRTKPPEPADINFDHAFVHESLTPLYYTPLYHTLRPAERRRYNQLTAMKINEQFILLEELLVDIVLPTLIRNRLAVETPGLCDSLDAMRQEEVLHRDMFVDLNRRCFPHLYRRSPYFFTCHVPLTRRAVQVCARAPQRLHFFLWLLLLIEEYTVGLSRIMMRQSNGGSVGPLDSTFRSVHAEHVKDEIRHVHVDCHLVMVFGGTRAGINSRLNQRLIAASLDALGAPRAASRVMRQLAEEFPRVAAMSRDLERALRALRFSTAYRLSLFNRELTPVSFAMLDRMPFAPCFGNAVPGYRYDCGH
jgi:hypothetical protein